MLRTWNRSENLSISKHPGTFSLRSVTVLPAVLLATLLPLLTACGHGTSAATAASTAASEIVLGGKVHGGQQPITGATVQLYAAGTTGDMSSATPLISTSVQTGPAGDFAITGLFSCPTITSEVYLIASGGNPGLSVGTNNTQSVLMSALGPCGNLSSSTHIVINEVSTIGSIYPITPFMSSYLKVGSGSADFTTMANDFMQINEFINTDGGQSPGPQLPGGFSAPVANLYTLANAMASCVNSSGGVAGDGSACGNFLLYAKPSGGTAPTNTADAILDIANNPTNNVTQIFSAASAVPAFQPTLSSAPADWSLKILPNIMLATPSNLVGVGSSNTGTITLGQAAPTGGLSITFTSDNTGAVTVSSPVVIAAGATTGSFTYNGIASGTANITATATGYVSATVQESATASLISLGTIPTVAPGQAVDLPLSLGTPAPAGGVTVNFTSSNTGIATISPSSVTIAAGLKVPSANPKVTGVTVGSTTINANATGYAPGSRGVNVSVTASFPATATVPIGTPINVTLTISAAAPAGGITFNLSSDSTSIFTVPATATIAAGNTTVQVPVTGVGPGTTTLRADSTGITEATSSITVNGSITLQSTTVTVGKLMQGSTYFAFQATPPGPTNVTITSSNPAIAVASASPTVAGSTVATISNVTSTSAQYYYVQGVAVGSTTFTIAATGYTASTVSVTVDPSGFIISGPSSISTTTLSSNTSVTVAPVVLSPTNSTVIAYGSMAPFGNQSVVMSSSNTAVGTISNSPLTFVANDSGESGQFQPVGGGTSTVSITQPAGFTTPLPSSTQQITATVSAPAINLQTTSITTGAGMEVSMYAALAQAPLTATNMTITSSNPAVVLASPSATAVGSSPATIPNVVNASAQYFYVQGVGTGTATLTIAATGYTSATVAVTVDPSGFILTTGNFSTTTFSGPTSVSITPAILNPATLAVLAYAAVSPSVAPVSVGLTSGTTSVGTITSSPVFFAAGSSGGSTNFQPAGAGTSLLSLVQPAGFTATSATASLQATATVTAPNINLQTATITTGVNLEVSMYAALAQVPPVATNIVLTSDTPSVATISTAAGIAGSASTTVPNVTNASAQYFYIQGQSTGTAHITITANGYNSASVTVTVDPSGFILTTGGFSTTTFSPSTAVSVQSAILNPGSLTLYGYASLNPGIGTASVAVNSSATQVGTVTSPLNFTGGTSNLNSTFQPVAAGSTNISIVQPAGYSICSTANTQQISVSVTAPPINLQTTSLIVGSNLESSPYVALSQIPPSAVTLTATVADPTVATLSTSATVNGSNQIAFTNLSSSSAQYFYVQGHNVGTTTVTFSAPGYANAVMNVTTNPSGFVFSSGNFSTTSFSLPTGLSIVPAILNSGSLTLYGYSQLAPSAGTVSVPVASSSTSVGTIPTPFTLTPGSTSATLNFTPVGQGTTNLTITTPAGFSTDSTASTQQVTATVTAPSIVVQNSAPVTGASLQINNYAALGVTPPSGVTLTVTSNNPAVVTVSKSASVAGTGSLAFTGLTSTSANYYYLQGQTPGTTTLTVSAPGYNSATVNVTVDPSGFVMSGGSFTTTTFSSPTQVSVVPAILNSGVLTLYGYAQLNPGVSAAVSITSSSPGVGTVTSPINFNPTDSSDYSTFQPVAAGTTTLSIGTPVGFSTPSQSSNTQITATVTAPALTLQNGSPTLGANLENQYYAALSVTPPAPTTLTLTSNNPAIVTLSTSATTVGTTAISFPSLTNGNAQYFYLQGQAVGTTTITVSAPGYATNTINVTVDPSGFVIYTPGNFSTTTTSSPTAVTIQPVILNPGVLTVNGTAALNPGLGTVSVPVGSTSPQVGTVSPTSLNFTAGVTALNTTFTPLTTGQTDIVIVSQPSGFTTPSQTATQQIVVTVQ